MGRTSATLLCLAALGAACGWTWSPPSPVVDGPVASFAAVALPGSGALVVAADAEGVARVVGSPFAQPPWSALAGAPGWDAPAAREGGCRMPALAATPDGAVTAACLAGTSLGSHIEIATLAAGASVWSAPAGLSTFVSGAPVLAVAADGTVIANSLEIDTSMHGECGGGTWTRAGSSGAWVEHRDLAFAAAVAAGNAVAVVGAGCTQGEPSHLFARVRRAGQAALGRRVTLATAPAVAFWNIRTAITPAGDVAIAWQHGTPPGARAGIDVAILGRGAVHWTCRPLIGPTTCGAALRGRGSGARIATPSQIRIAQLDALAGLPDRRFVALVHGRAPRRLYATTLAPGALRWSAAALLDAHAGPDRQPWLTYSEQPMRGGAYTTAVASDGAGGLLAAWPHGLPGEPQALRLARLAAGAQRFVAQGDFPVRGAPTAPVIVPPSGAAPAWLAWIDSVGAGGGALVAARAFPSAP